MKTLLDTWKELRSSKYSGDFALVLLAWGALRWAVDLEPMTIAALALGAGLLSASVDLMPDQSDE
jgi:hypothetical protein